VPVRDFAEKLRLTVVLLGCASQKDLCLLFRKVNPATEFDLERSYNWVQGRSRTGSATVYEDWAALLATDRPTGFLTSCSMDEFLDVVACRFDLRRAELARMAGDPAAEAEQAPPLAFRSARPHAAEIDRLVHAFLWPDDEPPSHLEAPAAADAELTPAVDRLLLPMLQSAARRPRAS